MSVQKLPIGQLLGDGFCVTKCLAFWTQEPSPRILPEVTLAYYRGTVPKYEKPKCFSYIETVPKAAIQGRLLIRALKVSPYLIIPSN